MTTAAYIRLSREDMKHPEELEERFALRAANCRELASKHGLTLDDSRIFTERQSGATIAARPVFQRLLQMIQSGDVTHLISPEYARLSRADKREDAQIEDIFCDAGLVLVTNEGVTDYGDEQFDPISHDVRALVARHELRQYRRRRQATNRAKAREAVRYCGYAPYGYRWLPDAARYEVIEDEYATVCEVFRRVRTESMYVILRSLNERLRATGQPLPPGVGRRADAAPTWGLSAMHRILINPHYAGYPAQRLRVVRGKRRKLDESEWLMAEEEQDYPHPITLAEHHQIRALLSSRQKPGTARTNSAALLTGILYCPAGEPMRGGGSGAYGCGCHQDGRTHGNRFLSSAVAHAIAEHVIRQALDALPADLAPAAPVADRAALHREYAAARKAVQAKQGQVDDLLRNVGLLVRSWGEDGYERAAQTARTELAAAEATVGELAARIERVDSAVPHSTIEAIRAVGFERFWSAADANERRLIARGVIERMDVEPASARWKHVRALLVKLRPPFSDHCRLRRVEVQDVVPHYMSRPRSG